MKLISKAITALILSFIPNASSFLRGITERNEVDGGASDRTLYSNGYGCGRMLQAALSNPVAYDPDDCSSNVCGSVTFICSDSWAVNGLTEITYSITGLTPGKHALHVHEFPVGAGGEEYTCTTTGGHWNPEAMNHGGNLDAQRHIGDLGNILADEDGVAEGTLLAYVPLRGSLGIVGRAVVVHEGTDDLGTGGDDGSRSVGNAGARPGCGTIRWKQY